MIPQLWLEDTQGRRFVPYGWTSHDVSKPPPGFKYMHSRFVRFLHEEVLRLKDEGGSERIFSGATGYDEKLVLALVRPTFMERVRAFFRYGRPHRLFSYDDAVLLAAVGCGRCLNSLAHRVGLKWGYRKGSEEWVRARDSCEFCVPEKVIYVGRTEETAAGVQGS